MRLLSKVAIGGGAVSAVTAGALVVGGVFATSATLVAVDPIARPAQADSLAKFDSCADLLDWYVENNLSEVGPYGWDYPYVLHGGRVDGDFMIQRAAPMAALGNLSASTKSMDSAAGARGSSETGTNTQEAAVDEPDVAKTDGKLLVRLTKPHHRNTDQMLAVSDVTGDEKNTLGRLHLPQASYDSQLLLVGDHVVVTQSVGGYGNPIAYDMAYRFGPTSEASTRVLDIDVSDPADPRLVRTEIYSGSLISARQYGDTVRLVTDTGRPELKWSTPRKGVSERAATKHNKQLVRESTIEDWLPTVKSAGQKKRLLDCADVLRPKVWSGSDTISVTTFKAGTSTDRDVVGITAAGGVVYSSADRLYVASTEWQSRDSLRGGPRARIIAPGDVVTDLHSFKLTDTGTSYVGSGHIDGSIRDRWSLDEYDGNLRVAWSTQGKRGTENGVSVLKERDNQLVEVGTLDGLGINENIQSVRWFDDLAIVVTFRQIDPLYTIDLSDPDSPRLLGKLKIPGYSGYLHPIGNDLLLGLGVAGNGFGNGGQAAVFDISDVTHPKQVSRVRFGNAYLQAIDDPRAFTWLPDQRTGLTAVANWGRLAGNESRLKVVALAVGDGGELETRTVAQLDEGWQPRVLPLDDGRVAVVDGDRVQLLSIP